MRRNSGQHASILKETTWQAWKLCKTSSDNYHWGDECLDMCGPKKETADGWSARLSPLQEPDTDNRLLWLCYIFGINLLFSACWYITLWLCFCFGIYSPVEHCKAWSRCQHQLQTSWYHRALKVLDLIYCECCTWNQGDVALNNWGKTCMVLWRHIKLNREMQLDIKALCKAGNGP